MNHKANYRLHRGLLWLSHLLFVVAVCECVALCLSHSLLVAYSLAAMFATAWFDMKMRGHCRIAKAAMILQEEIKTCLERPRLIDLHMPRRHRNISYVQTYKQKGKYPY